MRASHYYMLTYKRQQYRVVKYLYSGTNLTTSLHTYIFLHASTTQALYYQEECFYIQIKRRPTL
jgi:hypothetical protein